MRMHLVGILLAVVMAPAVAAAEHPNLDLHVGVGAPAGGVGLGVRMGQVEVLAEAEFLGAAFVVAMSASAHVNVDVVRHPRWSLYAGAFAAVLHVVMGSDEVIEEQYRGGGPVIGIRIHHRSGFDVARHRARRDVRPLCTGDVQRRQGLGLAAGRVSPALPPVLSDRGPSTSSTLAKRQRGKGVPNFAWYSFASCVARGGILRAVVRLAERAPRLTEPGIDGDRLLQVLDAGLRAREAGVLERDHAGAGRAPTTRSGSIGERAVAGCASRRRRCPRGARDRSAWRRDRARRATTSRRRRGSSRRRRTCSRRPRRALSSPPRRGRPRARASRTSPRAGTP